MPPKSAAGDPKSSCTIRVTAVIDMTKSAIPAATVLPPMVFVFPGGLAESLRYFKGGEAVEARATTPSKNARAKPVPEEKPADIEVLPTSAFDLTILNPAQFMAAFSSDQLRVSLDAPDQKAKGKDAPAPQAAAVDVSSLVVDIAVRDKVVLASSQVPDLVLHVGLFVRVVASAHEIDSTGALQRVTSFLPKSVTECGANPFLFRVLSMAGLPVVSDVPWRRSFLRPAVVAAKVLGIDCTSDNIAQDLFGGTAEQPRRMALVPSAEVPVKLNCVYTCKGVQEFPALQRHLKEQEIRIVVTHRAALPLGSSAEEAQPKKPQRPASSKGAKAKQEPEKEQAPPAFEAVATVRLSDLARGDRVYDEWLPLRPVFAAADRTAASTAVLSGASIQRVSAAGHAVTSPADVPYGNWEHARIHVVAALASPLTKGLAALSSGDAAAAKNPLSADASARPRNTGRPSSSTTVADTPDSTLPPNILPPTEPPRSRSEIQSFERVIIYLKPTDLYCAQYILREVAQTNINFIRRYNPQLAELYSPGTTTDTSSAASTAPGTAAGAVRGKPTSASRAFSKASSAARAPQSFPVAQADPPEWLAQCAGMLSTTRMADVVQGRGKGAGAGAGVGAGSGGGTGTDAPSVAHALELPAITGFHFVDPALQILVLEAPAALDLLTGIVSFVSRATRAQEDTEAATLLGPCVRAAPAVAFRKRAFHEGGLLLERFSLVHPLALFAARADAWSSEAASYAARGSLARLLGLVASAQVAAEPRRDALGRVISECSRTVYRPLDLDVRKADWMGLLPTYADVQTLRGWVGGVLPKQLRAGELLAAAVPPDAYKTVSVSWRPRDIAERREPLGADGMTASDGLAATAEVARDLKTVTSTLAEIDRGKRMAKCAEDRAAQTGRLPELGRQGQPVPGRDGVCRRRTRSSQPPAHGGLDDAAALTAARAAAGAQGAVLAREPYRDNAVSLCRPAYSERGTAAYARERGFCVTQNSKNGHWRSDPRLEVHPARADDLRDEWREDLVVAAALPLSSVRGAYAPPGGGAPFRTMTRPLEFFEQDRSSLQSVIHADEDYEHELALRAKARWRAGVVVDSLAMRFPAHGAAALRGKPASSVLTPLLQNAPQKYALKLANSAPVPDTRTRPVACDDPYTEPGRQDFEGMLQRSRPIRLAPLAQASGRVAEAILGIARQSELRYANREDEENDSDSAKEQRRRALRVDATRALMRYLRRLSPADVEGQDVQDTVALAKEIIRANATGDHRLCERAFRGQAKACETVLGSSYRRIRPLDAAEGVHPLLRRSASTGASASAGGGL